MSKETTDVAGENMMASCRQLLSRAEAAEAERDALENELASFRSSFKEQCDWKTRAIDAENDRDRFIEGKVLAETRAEKAEAERDEWERRYEEAFRWWEYNKTRAESAEASQGGLRTSLESAIEAGAKVAAERDAWQKKAEELVETNVRLTAERDALKADVVAAQEYEQIARDEWKRSESELSRLRKRLEEAERVMNGLADMVENASSGFISLSQPDNAWCEERDELVREARAFQEAG